ncbi:hypothetical protein HOY80DRAFT_1002266 [Tuber brumale]|nr:hypothetical protein HOY80DRAFT_1002266 [Tuber brumale]
MTEESNVILTVAGLNEKATEGIIYRVKEQKTIMVSCGVQAGIDAIAKLPVFETALSHEVPERGIGHCDIKTCVQHVYHELPKYMHGNNSATATRHEDHTVNEVATLVTLFQVQP